MLEKIGLPAKPSMRGSNWVVDASHCQGCSSQFTFINRKHHCRRCGGLFCGSCTNQRMFLRGQGDSAVRICDPCKKLEEAVRFEMRHGHTSRSSKGGSKLTTRNEDEVLNQILGTDMKQSSAIRNVFSDFDKGASQASSSSFSEEAVPPSVATQIDTAEETGSCSPKELLELSLEEKKKYKILKGEGKPEEALRAFKRGKELERQAKALEVTLRKNNRKALSSNSLAGKTKEEPDGFVLKKKMSSHIDKEEKNDLASELRELGWSDADLNDADKKPAKTSLEGELSTLLGEVHKKSGTGKGTASIDKTQVIALKKRALTFKREGKLAEAKEELKKAKVLEKQLEEQEFLGESEDSDDELSSLIHSMDDDQQDDFRLLEHQDVGLNFNHLMGVSDDLGLDGNFDVTEDDMEDPEISAALESFGWTEDLVHPVVPVVQPVRVDGQALLDNVLDLKKEALKQKRSGNVEEAMSLLRKAKLLERDAESLQFEGKNFMNPDPTSEKLTSETSGSSQSMKVVDETIRSSNVAPKLQPKSKLIIQRELLGLKKKALVLKREGRLDEAEEELRKGKVLECQLEEMESGSRFRAIKVNTMDSKKVHGQPSISGDMGLEDEDDEADVTEQDMRDPVMLKILENLGWKDEDRPEKHSNLLDSHLEDAIDPLLEPTIGLAVVTPKKSKAEIQRELLGLKRKALTLRRQGETGKAEELLRKAELLEAQMEVIGVSKKESLPNSVPNTHEVKSIHSLQESRSKPYSSLEEVPPKDTPNPALFSHLDNLGKKTEVVDSVNKPTKPSEQPEKVSELVTGKYKVDAPPEISTIPLRSKAQIQRELLALKRNALALRRQGETEEAEEVLKRARVLEAQMEEMAVVKKETLLDSIMDLEPDIEASTSKERSGVMISTEEVTKGKSEILVGSKDVHPDLTTPPRWNDSHITMPPSSGSISTSKTSQYGEHRTSLVEVDPPTEIKLVEHAGSLPQSGHSANLVDLLSGDDWGSSKVPVDEMGRKGSFNSNIHPSDNLYAQSGTSTSPNRVTRSKDEILSKNGERFVERVEKVFETSSTPLLDAQNGSNDQRSMILARKRKAVALKREGKIAEAREELRQAKLLEKSLQEEKPQTDAGSSNASVSTCSDTSPGQVEHKTSQQVPKPMTGRDRFKLQQESLAHKRQALKLRREGRMAEAEAESELAQALESQLEESSGHDSKSSNETDGMDNLGIEDLLDPQLLSALKMIGLQDAEMVPQAPDRPKSTKSNVIQSDSSGQEKSQLEERIRTEKVKAVNLKKAGKQAEALDALRRAKLYEKKLNTLT